MMGFLESIRDRARPGSLTAERAFPTPGEADPYVSFGGDPFGPLEYGDYLATSNDVYAVASRRARLVAGVPVRTYAGNDNDKTEQPESQVAQLLRYVNPHWTFPRLMRQTELSLCLWGSAYWVVERNRTGTPAELWWVKPTTMTPKQDARGYVSGFIYQPTKTGANLTFTPDEVVWFRYPNPIEQWSGLSPLAAARLAADVASASQKANRNLFEQGLQMGGVVMPTNTMLELSPEQADQVATMLQKRFKGVDQAHKWAVLRFLAEFKELHITPRDAEFVAGMNISFRQVCRAYGMQAGLQNDLEHATLANVQEFKRLEWEDTLVPELDFYAAELREQLLPKFGRRNTADHLEFDTSKVAALQRANTETWDRERQQIDVGAITINEWRSRHGMPTVAWGDVAWLQVNKSPVSGPDDMPTDDPDVANDSLEVS